MPVDQPDVKLAAVGSGSCHDLRWLSANVAIWRINVFDDWWNDGANIKWDGRLRKEL
ncbi:hypothetical protein MESS4_610032 [Mesorhizobium sp. STM 4661]|nr:hypothetical protein MESS4_610032 [Mesorhizobium sp. STM 4661]